MSTARVPMEYPERGVVVAELVDQGGHDNGRVEQRVHSAGVTGDTRVAGVPFGPHEVPDVEWTSRRAVVHQYALLADERRFRVGPAQRDPVRHGLDLEFATRQEVELFAKRLRHNEAASCVNGNFHAATVL